MPKLQKFNPMCVSIATRQKINANRSGLLALTKKMLSPNLEFSEIDDLVKTLKEKLRERAELHEVAHKEEKKLEHDIKRKMRQPRY